MSEEGYNVRFGVKKDMLAYTDGPSLRVNVMHISIPKDRYDGMEDSLPLGEA
jgi:hypothetical protein